MAKRKSKKNRNIGDSVDILNYISPDHIIRIKYNTGNNDIDITDIPQNLNSSFTLGQGGGSSVTVEELNVTENGTYEAPEGKAYSPVNVNVGGGTKYSYKLGDEDFYLFYCSIGMSGGNITTSNNNNRRSTFITEPAGEKKITSTFVPAAVPALDIYPIPIPSDAVRVDVAITPNTQYVALNVYNLSEGSYTRTHDSGWQQGSYSYDINVGTDMYLIVTTKYDAAGTSYPTDPTDFTIDFF